MHLQESQLFLEFEMPHAIPANSKKKGPTREKGTEGREKPF